MPLVRQREPFSHPDWLFEIKHDGFRALAYIEHGMARLLSRNGDWLSFPVLCDPRGHERVQQRLFINVSLQQCAHVVIHEVQTPITNSCSLRQLSLT